MRKEPVNLLLPGELKAEIVALAKQEERSMGQTVQHLLEQALGKRAPQSKALAGKRAA